MVSNKLLNRLKKAHHITVITGPDLAAESGIDMSSKWEGFSTEKLATSKTLNNDPGIFWKYFNHKRKELAGIKPNLGHYALVDFNKHFGQFDLITLNWDNLHTVASSRNVIELSGNLMKTRCSKCQYSRNEQDLTKETIPNCPECGGLLRPDIILNDEEIEKSVFNNAQKTAETCEVFFSIGVSHISEKVSSLPFMAKGNGSYLVEINTTETNLSAHADETILAKASKILPLMFIVLDKIK